MLALRDQYVERFNTIPAVQLCTAHDGEFRDGEVERLGGAKTPGVYVACMGLVEDDELDVAGPLQATLAWVAFVLVRSPDAIREARASAGDLAALIALAIVYQLTRGDAFPAALARAKSFRAQNLFGTASAKRGHTLWAVTWHQSTEITPEGLEAVLAAFRTFHTDVDVDQDGVVDMSGTKTLPIDRDLSGAAEGDATATGDLES